MPKRSPDPAEPNFAVENVPLYRRIPWTALAISLAVLLSNAFAVEPVRDASTRMAVTEAYLVRPVSYVVIAPLSNVLDTLTLLSVNQHIALVSALFVIFALWRVSRRWLAAPSERSVKGHLYAGAALLIGLFAVYAASALLWRPMAALVSNNPSIVRVDFHSHTDASHDGHQTVERLRSWHNRAGYDVTYVTDHATVAAAERGIAANPATAAGGTMILQGIEATWNGEHVTILSAERFYRGLLTPNKRDIDVRGVELGSLISGREPVIIWNHPRQIDRIPAAAGPGTPGIRAIEILTGAPATRDVLFRNRAAILALAERANVPLTIGSDNHGWGYATPGWTLLRLFGWRGLSTDELSARIERSIRDGGAAATRVVERRVAEPGPGAARLALTIFAAPARMLTTISNEERVAWLAWTWLLAGLLWLRRRRRRTS